MKLTSSHILWTLLLILPIALISHSRTSPCERAPLTANLQDSASSRWLEKKVLESRILDDMESLGGWTAFTHGPEGVVDARVTAAVTRASSVVAEMTLTSSAPSTAHQ